MYQHTPTHRLFYGYSYNRFVTHLLKWVLQLNMKILI